MFAGPEPSGTEPGGAKCKSVFGSAVHHFGCAEVILYPSRRRQDARDILFRSDLFLFLSFSFILSLNLLFSILTFFGEERVSDFQRGIGIATSLAQRSAGLLHSPGASLKKSWNVPGRHDRPDATGLEPFLCVACREERLSRWKLGYRVASVRISPPLVARRLVVLCAVAKKRAPWFVEIYFYTRCQCGCLVKRREFGFRG